MLIVYCTPQHNISCLLYVVREKKKKNNVMYVLFCDVSVELNKSILNWSILRFLKTWRPLYIEGAVCA